MSKLTKEEREDTVFRVNGFSPPTSNSLADPVAYFKDTSDAAIRNSNLSKFKIRIASRNDERKRSVK
jgi:hypothetical protein